MNAAPDTIVARLRRLARLAAAACLLLFPLILAPRPSLAATPAQTSRVQLSVSLAQSSYPREALVLATVRMRNISRAPVLVGSAPSIYCAKIGPSAVVLSEQGAQVYPPAIHGGLVGSCGPYGLDSPWTLVRLLPGHTMTRHRYVILRGPAIQAVGTYYLYRRDTYLRFQAASQPLTVSLYDAPSPALTLTTSPGYSATITPPADVAAGTLRVAYQWLCPDGQGAKGGDTLVTWVPVQPDAAGTYTLQPGCAQPYQWHVAAGFPNQPVVYIDYCRPSQWGC